MISFPMYYFKYPMKAIELTKNLFSALIKRLIRSRLISTISRFIPRTHALIAICLSVILVILASLPSEKAIASRNTKTIELPALSEARQSPPPQDQTPAPERLAEAPINRFKKETVKSGDNLSKIFHRAGLSDNEMFKLVNSSKQAKGLARLRPGQEFTFEITQKGKLSTLTRHIDRLNSETFALTDKTYAYSKNEKQPTIELAMRRGTIKSSLYNAGTAAGLDDELIMELAGIFGWDIDFALDLRSGDSFKILFEEKFLEGEHIGAGQILAAEFTNQNTTFKAVMYTDKKGRVQYYSPTGKAMRKAFLRAPLDFRRISSNFNPRRLHPITKRVKPHRGTDYAASRGTPVWAAGDGKVISSGYTKANGNYIVIQHGGDIRTKYLHLHKRKVKKGSRVKQKQVIGTVGSTGMSNGPHLHYEFLLSGVHRNPRTIVKKLPKARSVPKNELQRFFAQTQPLVAHLQQSTKVAGFMRTTTKL